MDEVIPSLDEAPVTPKAVGHSHHNGFRHLDLPLGQPLREYHLGWRFDPHGQYPPIEAAEPYLVLYIPFARPGSPRETMQYALTRTYWQRTHEVCEEDRRTLWNLAMAQLPRDLAAIQRGERPQALSANRPMYLSPHQAPGRASSSQCIGPDPLTDSVEETPQSGGSGGR